MHKHAASVFDVQSNICKTGTLTTVNPPANRWIEHLLFRWRSPPLGQVALPDQTRPDQIDRLYSSQAGKLQFFFFIFFSDEIWSDQIRSDLIWSDQHHPYRDSINYVTDARFKPLREITASWMQISTSARHSCSFCTGIGWYLHEYLHVTLRFPGIVCTAASCRGDNDKP